jgi:hypothetical protein
MWRVCLFYSFGASAHYVIVKGLGYEVDYRPLSSLSPWPPPHGTIAPSGPGPPHYQGISIIIRHTTLVMTLLDEWPSRNSDLFLTTQHSMSLVGFKPAATEIGHLCLVPRLQMRGTMPPLTMCLNGMHKGNFIRTCTCLFVCWLQSLLIRV